MSEAIPMSGLAASPSASGQEAFAGASGMQTPGQPAAQSFGDYANSLGSQNFEDFMGMDTDRIVSNHINESKPYWSSMKDASGKSVYEHYMDSNPNDGQPQEQAGGIGLPGSFRLPDAEKDMSQSTYTTDLGGQLGKVGMNTLKTAWNLPAGIVNSILHPYDTFKGIATLGLGLGDMAFNPKSDQAEMARQFLSKHLYGIGVENPSEVISKVWEQAKNDPAQLALNISGLLKAVSVAGKMGEAGKLGTIGNRAATSGLGQSIRGMADKGAKPFDLAMEYTNPAALLSMGGKGAARATGMSKADVERFSQVGAREGGALNAGIQEGAEFGQSATKLKNAGADSEFIQGARKDVEGISGNTATREGVQDIYKSHQSDATPVRTETVNDVRGEILKQMEARGFKIDVAQDGSYSARALGTESPVSTANAQKVADFLHDHFETAAQNGMKVGDLAKFHDQLNDFLGTSPGTSNHFAGGVRDAMTNAFGRAKELGGIKESAQAANLRRTVFGENGTPESVAAQFTSSFVKGGKLAEQAKTTIRDLAKFAKNEGSGEALIQKLDDYATGFRNSKVSGVGAGFVGGALSSAVGGHIVGPLVGAIITAAKSPKLMARLVQYTSMPARQLSKLGEFLSRKLYGTGNAAQEAGAAMKKPVGDVTPDGDGGPSAGSPAVPEAPMAPMVPEAAPVAPKVTATAPKRHSLEKDAPMTREQVAAKKQRDAEMDARIKEMEAATGQKKNITTRTKKLAPDVLELRELKTKRQLAAEREKANKPAAKEVASEPVEKKAAPAKKAAPVKKSVAEKNPAAESKPVAKKEATVKKQAPKVAEPAKKAESKKSEPAPKAEKDTKPLKKMGAAELKKTLNKMSAQDLISEMQKAPGGSDLRTALIKEWNIRRGNSK